MKLLSCRRAPDAKRGCPPATAVAGASSPSIPEAGAAPRHLSSGGQVGGGPLGPKPVGARALAAFAVPVEQTAPRTQRLRFGVFVAGRDHAPQLRTPMARPRLIGCAPGATSLHPALSGTRCGTSIYTIS